MQNTEPYPNTQSESNMPKHKSKKEAISEAKAVIDAINSSDDLNQQVAAIRKIIPNAKIVIGGNGFIQSVTEDDEFEG